MDKKTWKLKSKLFNRFFSEEIPASMQIFLEKN